MKTVFVVGVVCSLEAAALDDDNAADDPVTLLVADPGQVWGVNGRGKSDNLVGEVAVKVVINVVGDVSPVSMVSGVPGNVVLFSNSLAPAVPASDLRRLIDRIESSRSSVSC